MSYSNKNEVRIVLGTAQLGLDYGIANTKGKPDLDESLAIVSTVWNEGVRFFDTAQAYGESESVLGRCFRTMRKNKTNDEPRIITKLKPDIDPTDICLVLDEMDASIERLGVRNLWGLMLHRESWLDIDRIKLSKTIEKVRAKSNLEHFGVSVYSPEKALNALDIDGIDIVQLPFNVFDQRAREQAVFDFAEKHGKTVFVRSIYLQGLLLMTPDQIPPQMSFCVDKLEEFRSVNEKHGISAQLAALAFAIHNAPGAFFVLGAETQEQIKESIYLYRKAARVNLPDLAWLASHDPLLINPSCWS